MRAVLSASAMREADSSTIDGFGIPGFTLMESAGRAAASILVRSLHPPDRILCCCGPGNNGGDGLVVARILATAGYAVDVLLTGAERSATPDTQKNLKLLDKLIDESDSLALSISRLVDISQIANSRATWIVDALVGTGARGALREPVASVVRAINEHPAKILALDIPSGLDGDRGVLAGPVVAACQTICFAALKPGVVLNDGPGVSGKVDVVEIGIPPHILQRYVRHPMCGLMPDERDIVSLLPKRAPNAHKYSSGTLGVIAGSPGLTGAPVLASNAGFRAGAGAVLCATRSSIRETVEQKVVEVMTSALPDSPDGIDLSAAQPIVQHLFSRSDALVVGCGIGREHSTGQFVRGVLEEYQGPIVVDADALFAIGQDTDLIKRRSNGKWILTPHQGEFERLVGSKVDWTNRATIASESAAEWNCVLVMKGNPTVVGTPMGPTYFNPTGNVSLATAGTGDVLAGMVGGYLAQGLTPLHATLTAAFIGGRVADRYFDRVGASTMIASDIVDGIVDVVSALVASQE